jgi:hypothetical protein
MSNNEYLHLLQCADRNQRKNPYDYSSVAFGQPVHWSDILTLNVGYEIYIFL